MSLLVLRNMLQVAPIDQAIERTCNGGHILGTA